MHVDDDFAVLKFFEDRLQGRVSEAHAVGIREENKAIKPEDVECVGELLDPPDSMTRTCAPDADNSAARTEPAAPAPTTMKSYRFSSFDALVILNPQYLKSDFSDNRLEGPPTVASRPSFVTPVLYGR